MMPTTPDGFNSDLSQRRKLTPEERQAAERWEAEAVIAEAEAAAAAPPPSPRPKDPARWVRRWFVLTLLVLGGLVYGTRHKYQPYSIGPNHMMLRVNRWTGETFALVLGQWADGSPRVYWVPMLSPEEAERRQR